VELRRRCHRICEMKHLGELHYFLGLEVWRNVGQTFMSQGKYAREVLEKFKMDQCKVSYVPMEKNKKLYGDYGLKEVNDKFYIQWWKS
jgi:hypothetical protein